MRVGSTVFRFWWPLLAALTLLVAAVPAAGWADEIKAYLFWHDACPHCERARAALAEISKAEPDLRLVEIQVGVSDRDDALFYRSVAYFGLESAAVPLFVVGDAVAVGFSAGANTPARYRDMIARCRDGGCPDVIGARGAGADPQPSSAPETVTLPVWGELAVRDLSLPVLAVGLAAVDGFNPCAMWVLAILIGFLLGVEERRRMWTLGLVFLLTTGVMYFAIMAAWLNVVLWIGALSWIRWLVGGVSVAAGVHYLREYWTNPEGVCRVTPYEQRRSITARFRALVDEPSLLLASLGIAALAVAVNLIELVCSAGVPAVFTQVLAMHDLPSVAYYGYLLLYIAVFLLDDTAIFVAAMVTLRSVAAVGRYARLSHLLGGMVLIALGAVMILRPDLLA